MLAPAPVETASPKQLATESFYRGKALALSGDSSCAGLAFDEALEAFRSAARPGNAEDLAFAEDLYDSVQLYRKLGDARAEERPPVEDAHDTLIAEVPASTPQEIEQAKREIAEAVTPFDIPMTVNEPVLRAVAFFQFRTPKAFAGALQRSGRYLDLMRGILRDEGLPQDLVYVAMVESAFKHQAHSRKAAHGFWQFIEGTARRYGLRMTREIDERRDPFKSTRAAAAYLRDLYEMFGDWYLAMAAYDAGEGKIIRGLQRTGARDYWELSSGSFLHRETRDYVPFVLAAALIAKNPVRFGFEVVPDPPAPYDVVTVTRPVDLSRVADAVGAPVEELRLLNPELKLRTTPRGVAEYPLKVPAGSSVALLAKLGSLPAAPEAVERRVKVRKGDTVARVAARYGVSIADLCDWNDLSRSARLKKGTTVLLLLARKASAPRGPVVSAVVASTAPLADPAPRGEIRALPTPSAAVTDASQVAASRGTPAGSAPAPRPLPSRVDIPAEGFQDGASRASASPAPKTSPAVYTVRRGDTLFSIAQQFGTTVNAIRKLNRLRSRGLAVGTRLVLAPAFSQ